MAKRVLKPDTRPRWNDPDLKVLYRGKYYTAEEYQILCQHAMIFDMSPSYKSDVTYNLKRKKYDTE